MIDPQFVHHFGEAAERIREPDEAWPDELQYILAKRGLRFDRLETRHAGLPNRRLHPRCAYRRLFCDGEAVARVEIGIANNYSSCPITNLSIEDILTITRQLAEMPTTVRDVNGTRITRPIVAQGKHLAKLYAHASTNRAFSDNDLGLQLVEAANPIVIVELTPHEANLDFASPPEGLIALKRSSVNGANAIFCHLNTKSGIVPTWILQKGTSSIVQLRSLRLCLSRLHAERGVLDLILKQIHRKRLLNPSDEEDINLLDRYFNDRIKIVNRNTWGKSKIKQSEIVAAFDAAQAVIRPASQTQLMLRYDDGRKQVWEKIKAYQEQRLAVKQVKIVNVEKGAIMVDKSISVSGSGNIINVAKFMSNVTNIVNNNLAEPNVDKQARELINQLNEHIERIAPEIDPSQLKKMGKNIEALSKEAASDEPEKRWYQVSIEGLKEAAQAVGEIAQPMIGILEKLATLLLK